MDRLKTALENARRIGVEALPPTSAAVVAKSSSEVDRLKKELGNGRRMVFEALPPPSAAVAAPPPTSAAGAAQAIGKQIANVVRL